MVTNCVLSRSLPKVKISGQGQMFDDRWNTVQSICVFVSNQAMFAVSMAQHTIMFHSQMDTFAIFIILGWLQYRWMAEQEQGPTQ